MNINASLNPSGSLNPTVSSGMSSNMGMNNVGGMGMSAPMTLNQASLNQALSLPEDLQGYHSLVPLEDRKSVV